jgi:teichuronic acid biosynthesis glycosyltransferase TuaH
VTDVVLISLEPWDGVWRRNQHLVTGLLRGDPRMRVLFVEPPADPLHSSRRRRMPRGGRGLRRAPDIPGISRDALWLFEPTKYLPRRVDPHVDLRIADHVAHTAERLGFTRPVLWVNDPAGAATMARTGWPALYDVTDDWLEADRPPAEHGRLAQDEEVLLQRCAEVVVCSPALARSKGASREVTLVRNAVDTAAYRSPRPRPASLPEGPVAVYVGTVHRDRLDVDLCVATARGVRGRVSLVLVGPPLLEPTDLTALRASGTVLTGPVDRDAVPGFLQHADVLVVPHVVTPFTDSLDPIKVYEYAAVGRPVVSTPVAGFRDSDDDRVTIASGPEFVEAVGRRATAPSAVSGGARRSVPDWSARVEQMRDVIRRLPGTEAGRTRRESPG